MAGNKPAPMVVQSRDLAILTALDHLRVLDREQAMHVGRFGSVTRVNTRLLQMVRAGLLLRLTVGTTQGGHRNLYARSRQGAAVVHQSFRTPPWNAQSPIVAGQPLLEHQLRLNQLFFALHHPQTAAGLTGEQWRTFTQPPIAAVPRLIPDAYVTLCGATRRALFVEIDLATEPLRTWTRKAESYLELARSDQFQPMFGHPQFGVAVITTSMRRLQGIRAAIATRTDKLFWLTTFDEATADRMATAVWWRPTGDAPVFIL